MALIATAGGYIGLRVAALEGGPSETDSGSFIFNRNEVLSDIKELASKRLFSAESCTPILLGDTLIVTTGLSVSHINIETGDVMWVSWVESPPVAILHHDNLIIVAMARQDYSDNTSLQTSVAAIHLSDGRIAWLQHFPAGLVSDLTLTEQLVLVPLSTGIVALALSGDLAWFINSARFSRLSVQRNNVAIAEMSTRLSQQSQMSGIDLETGRLLWAKSFVPWSILSTVGSPGALQPMLAGDTSEYFTVRFQAQGKYPGGMANVNERSGDIGRRIRLYSPNPTNVVPLGSGVFGKSQESYGLKALSVLDSRQTGFKVLRADIPMPDADILASRICHGPTLLHLDDSVLALCVVMRNFVGTIGVASGEWLWLRKFRAEITSLDINDYSVWVVSGGNLLGFSLIDGKLKRSGLPLSNGDVALGPALGATIVRQGEMAGVLR